VVSPVKVEFDPDPPAPGVVTGLPPPPITAVYVDPLVNDVVPVIYPPAPPPPAALLILPPPPPATIK
jgi:hypothetical protein